jgi:hypothetical protein
VPVPVLGPELGIFPAVVGDDDEAGIVVIVRPTRLPRRLPPRDRELRRERAPPGVEAPERDLREEEAPDLVRWWWRLLIAVSSGISTRLVELSRLESQLWPFSSRVDEAKAIPARSIHSASMLGVCGVSGKWRRPGKVLAGFFCVLWWRGFDRPWLWRFESLDGPVRFELLLRVWRVCELLREWERIGGVLGTEMLDR